MEVFEIIMGFNLQINKKQNWTKPTIEVLNQDQTYGGVNNNPESSTGAYS